MLPKVTFYGGLVLCAYLLNSGTSTIAQAQNSSPQVICYPNGGCVHRRSRTGNSSDLRDLGLRLGEEGTQPTIVWHGLPEADTYSITLFETTQSEPLAVVTQPATAFAKNEGGAVNFSYPLAEMLTVDKQYKIVLGAQIPQDDRVKIITDEIIFEVIPEYDRPSSTLDNEAT